jgi:methionyl-tRNA formyltransferase
VSKVRVVFLGTPEFAVTCLKALVEDEHFEVVGVVTQPDRPAGRKMQLQPSPVKSFCLAHGLRVISPESVNTESMLQQLEVWAAEVAVVVAFGQLLSEKFLKLFPLGAVNVHGSLLPRWRGAAPIQRSIEFGDQETGVALQKVVKKLDAGDVLGFRKMPITDETDSQMLYEQMAVAGADLLHVELMDYVRGNLAGEPQDETQVTYAKKIEKSEGEIDWTKSARAISQKVRAFVTGPGTWSYLEGKKVKIHKVKILEAHSSAQPGSLVKVESGELIVQTGQGQLSLLELQPESRNRLKTSDFLKGYQLKTGDAFTGEKK